MAQRANHGGILHIRSSLYKDFLSFLVVLPFCIFNNLKVAHFLIHSFISIMRATLIALLGIATQAFASNFVSTCSASQLIKGVPFPTMIDVTLQDLEFGLETGLFTSAELVQTYLDRIMEVNSTLHMVTEVNPDALSIAAELDAMRANGTILGPLHGVVGSEVIP